MAPVKSNGKKRICKNRHNTRTGVKRTNRKSVYNLSAHKFYSYDVRNLYTVIAMDLPPMENEKCYSNDNSNCRSAILQEIYFAILVEGRWCTLML